MNPDQQIPTGVPVSQNSYPYPPNCQDLSADLHSESAQIQVPLLKNHQQYCPPDFVSDNQQDSISQQGQLSGPIQDENPPDQSTMVAGLPSADPEREEKIKDIEKELDRGCSNAYYIWLYCNIFCGILMSIPLSICLFVLLGSLVSSSPEWPAFGMALIWATWWIWSLRQCIMMKNAIKNKSLEGARRGYGEMIWFIIYYLPTFIVFLLLDNLEFNTSNGGVYLKMKVTDYAMVLTLFYVPLMFINLFGATKVVDLLEEKEALICESTNTQDETETNLAEPINHEKFSV